jgi:branched-chain amino acid transport system permease protein
MLYRGKRPVQDQLPAPISRSFPSRRTASVILALAGLCLRRCAACSPTSTRFCAILVPFLILSLAALGVNILVGYCGQISLGSGAFMAVGAYAAYNCMVRIDGMPLVLAILLGRCVRDAGREYFSASRVCV